MDAITRKRLLDSKNIWVVTVRPDGRPHMTPVWFVLHESRLVICISDKSVKARNLRSYSRVACALEDGNQPVICEGKAAEIKKPWPESICADFKARYDWDIQTDPKYNLLIEITPEKWLQWN